MNKRNINIHLHKKFSDLLNSIDDLELREIVNKNAIITGGCIASLLMNDKVHDYDIYFKTKEATLAVARHYVGIFNEMRSAVGHSSSLAAEVTADDGPEGRVRIKVPSAGVLGEETEEKDYQFFESTQGDEAEEFLQNLVEEGDDVPETVLKKSKELKKYHPVFVSANAITLSDHVQLVIRFFGSPTDIHKNFDYVHCFNHWTPDGGVVLKKEALTSLLTKELQYVGSLYPVASVVRMRKFMKRGWYINAGQILKMCLQLSELNLHDFSVLEEQLTGVDTAYFQELLDIAKSDAEAGKEIDSIYICSLIDKLL